MTAKSLLAATDSPEPEPGPATPSPAQPACRHTAATPPHGQQPPPSQQPSQEQERQQQQPSQELQQQQQQPPEEQQQQQPPEEQQQQPPPEQQQQQPLEEQQQQQQHGPAAPEAAPNAPGAAAPSPGEPAAARHDDGRFQQQLLAAGSSGSSVTFRARGTLFEVGVATLLARSPPGSYFRALLRFYGVEDEHSSLQQLHEAQQRAGGSLFVDEDPEIFRLILTTISYSDDDGAGGVAALPPLQEPARLMLRAAADRLGLCRLVRLLTPPSSITDHLSPSDMCQREQEEQQRRLFVSDPAAMVAAWRAGELLLDVFEPATFPRFVYQAQPPPGAPGSYPRLFSHLAHPTQCHPPGSRAVVADLATFKRSFNFITGGLFEGVDWSNMVVAGGAVLACLMRPPAAVEASDPATPAGKELWTSWLGPNRLVRETHHWRHVTVLTTASSGFGDSDIDIFFHGLNRQQATSKLSLLMRQLHFNRAQRWDYSLAVRSEHAVTLVVETGDGLTTHAQVVLRCYSCPAEVLIGFDIDSCCVAFDGDRVWSTPRALRAISRRQNVVDPGRLSPSYESRLAKYSRRGFQVAVPGFPGRKAVDSSIYLLPYTECKGLAKLLRLEQRSINSGYQVGFNVRTSRCWDSRRRLRGIHGLLADNGGAVEWDLQRELEEADAEADATSSAAAAAATEAAQAQAAAAAAAALEFAEQEVTSAERAVSAAIAGNVDASHAHAGVAAAATAALGARAAAAAANAAAAAAARAAAATPAAAAGSSGGGGGNEATPSNIPYPDNATRFRSMAAVRASAQAALDRIQNVTERRSMTQRLHWELQSMPRGGPVLAALLAANAAAQRRRQEEQELLQQLQAELQDVQQRILEHMAAADQQDADQQAADQQAATEAAAAVGQMLARVTGATAANQPAAAGEPPAAAGAAAVRRELGRVRDPSDYSSVFLPKHMGAFSLVSLLTGRSALMRRAGARIPFVWYELDEGRSWKGRLGDQRPQAVSACLVGTISSSGSSSGAELLALSCGPLCRPSAPAAPSVDAWMPASVWQPYVQALHCLRPVLAVTGGLRGAAAALVAAMTETPNLLGGNSSSSSSSSSAAGQAASASPPAADAAGSSTSTSSSSSSSGVAPAAEAAAAGAQRLRRVTAADIAWQVRLRQLLLEKVEQRAAEAGLVLDFEQEAAVALAVIELDAIDTAATADRLNSDESRLLKLRERVDSVLATQAPAAAAAASGAQAAAAAAAAEESSNGRGGGSSSAGARVDSDAGAADAAAFSRVFAAEVAWLSRDEERPWMDDEDGDHPPGNAVLDASELLETYPWLKLSIPVCVESAWLAENPGRQGKLTGSFQPLEGDPPEAWTCQAYGCSSADD